MRLTNDMGRKPDLIRPKATEAKESSILRLDNSKARNLLGWRPLLDIEATLKWTSSWYRAFLEDQNMKELTIKQIDEFEKFSGETDLINEF